MSSAPSNSNFPGDGCTADHFISFSGVALENCCATSWR